MNRRETVEFVNMCMVYDGEKVLVQDRVSPDWPGITFLVKDIVKYFKTYNYFHLHYFTLAL